MTVLSEHKAIRSSDSGFERPRRPRACLWFSQLIPIAHHVAEGSLRQHRIFPECCVLNVEEQKGLGPNVGFMPISTAREREPIEIGNKYLVLFEH